MIHIYEKKKKKFGELLEYFQEFHEKPRAPTTLKSEEEVTSLSGADKREVRDNREKSKYFYNCTTFHVRGALSWHSYVIMYLLCIKVYSVVV